ncbi:hypothetical protein AH06_58 [Erwinia phage AH06]|nr:hypothetical protein AH06_58 [Erwinia phage AH06]
MTDDIIEPFHVNEGQVTDVWYVASDINHAREQYEHFVENHSHHGISEGENQWEQVCREAELEDQEYPAILVFYLNFDHADRHECRIAPLSGALLATPPELIAHYQLTN